MEAKRRRSGVHSIPDKTSTGTKRPVRRTHPGVGRGENQSAESRAKVSAYQVKGRKKKTLPPPQRVKIEETEKGKRWLSPGEVELHGDVLEVRDEYGKIVDSVLLPDTGEKAREQEKGKEGENDSSSQ